MQTKPFPENTTLRFTLFAALPVMLWSIVCFMLIVMLDHWVPHSTSVWLGITVGLLWLSVSLCVLLLAYRWFLPNKQGCPACGESMKLQDDGERSLHYYECDQCQIRWQTNLNRGTDS